MDMNKMLKQAQQMQNRMQKVQQEIAVKQFEGQAGGGAIKAVATGEGSLVSIKIDPSIVKDGDVEMLEELVVLAVGEAIEKGKAEMQAELSKMTGGMRIPGF
ncbi:MAG TPA: YbaB/EbfC family nucleoid-associated protein [Candidatus Methylacidiphilales bacterium]|nr:YbaB/EbfC family nucleoid-associated protein [Candidatus Methylacidiphilales bacterium]